MVKSVDLFSTVISSIVSKLKVLPCVEDGKQFCVSLVFLRVHICLGLYLYNLRPLYKLECL